MKRRRMLAATAGLPAALLMPSLARAAAPAAPIARKAPVTDKLWNEDVVDTYRWMENPKDPEWKPFMKGRAAHARRVLDAIPGRKALYERVSALSGGLPLAFSPQTTDGGRLFYQMRPAG